LISEVRHCGCTYHKGPELLQANEAKLKEIAQRLLKEETLMLKLSERFLLE
jgi:hypothetical protein